MSDDFTAAAKSQMRAAGWTIDSEYFGPRATGKTTRAKKRAAALRATGHEVSIEHVESGGRNGDRLWRRRA